MDTKIQYYKNNLKEKGITYEKLSEMSGIPLNTLKNIFRGKTEHPRIDTVQAIERALGLDTPQWTDEERAQGVTGIITRKLTPEEDNLLSTFRQIGQKKGNTTQDLAQKILEQILNS